jgi:hypothetical protein
MNCSWPCGFSVKFGKHEYLMLKLYRTKTSRVTHTFSMDRKRFIIIITIMIYLFIVLRNLPVS